MGLQADGSWVSADGKFRRTREKYLADNCKDEWAFAQHRAGRPIAWAVWKKMWPQTLRYRQVMARVAKLDR